MNKRLSHRYQFLANYTYTDADDNFSTLRVPPKGGETSFLFSNNPEPRRRPQSEHARITCSS